jgi:hypothetical protein
MGGKRGEGFTNTRMKKAALTGQLFNSRTSLKPCPVSPVLEQALEAAEAGAWVAL